MEKTSINISLADRSQPLVVKKSLSKLSSSNAPGQDFIPAKIYASCSPLLIDKLTEFFSEMWKQEKILQELKDIEYLSWFA